MELQPGQSLLHYRIAAKLGEGGMGVVWRATDTTLDRDVAIKVLPEAFAADPERLARFEREAKTLASLNHAGIASVHGLHEVDGARFLVMELVEGEDLAQRLSRGPLAVEDALDYARQIADAVEAAHEAGVIHRDLKPANVLVTPAGKVKVLDFGLAKALSADPGPASSAGPSMSPTITSVGTVAGVILGTAAYMSPEQAKGRMVDRRADIWAFGCLLYEMLTGRRTFEGESISETLASVLKDDVSWEALPAETPRAARRLLRRCLDRDANTRLRDIGEARVALGNVDDEPMAETSAPGVAATAPSRGWPGIVAAIALGLIGVAVGWHLRPAEPPELLKVDIADTQISIAENRTPRISPDGRRVTYFVERTLMIRDLDSAAGRPLTDATATRDAFWSPDGSQVGYYQEGALHRVAVDGGTPTLIARTGEHVPGSGSCWSEDGRIVYSRGNTPLFEVPAVGGEPRVLLEPDPDKNEDHFHGCTFLPDDRGILYVVHPAGMVANTVGLLTPDGATRYVLQIDDMIMQAPTWSDSGHLVFARSGQRQGVWALPFELDRLEPTGEAFPIASGGSVSSTSRDGSLLYAPGQIQQSSRLLWLLPDGAIDGTAVELDRDINSFSVAPDGERIVAAVVGGGASEIWVLDLARGVNFQVTEGTGFASDPEWSPDGSKIVFARSNRIYVVDPISGSEPRMIGEGLSPAFSRDGRSVLVHRDNAEGRYDLWLLDVTEATEARLLLAEQASERWPQFSPDGRFILYGRGPGPMEVVIARYPDLDRHWQASTGGAAWARWSFDGKRIYYASPATDDPDDIWLHAVDFSADPDVVLGVPTPLFSLTENGMTQRYETTPEDDRYLVLADEAGREGTHLVLVRNWFEEFRAR